MNNVDPATGKTQLQVRRDIDKWYLIHQSSLDVALRQISQLDVYPERVDSYALKVHIDYNPNGSDTATLFTVIGLTTLSGLHPDQFGIPRLRQPNRPDLRKGMDMSRVKPTDELAALCLDYKGNSVVHGTLITKAHFPRLHADNWNQLLPHIIEGRVSGRKAGDTFYCAMRYYVSQWREHIVDPDKYVSVRVEAVGRYICTLKSFSDPSFSRHQRIDCDVLARHD
ncbi:hypothetical protein OF83DRAFT_1136965 [Amylostereum chailletii]|nr:hypothetical protein OF83DRAFT_1136965 [Amylostereum chailletii]